VPTSAPACSHPRSAGQGAMKGSLRPRPADRGIHGGAAARVARAAERVTRPGGRGHGLPLLREAVESRLQRRHQPRHGGGRAARCPGRGARHDRKIIVERAVRSRARSSERARQRRARASLPGEITYDGRMVRLRAKYARERGSHGGVHRARAHARVREIAVAAFRIDACMRSGLLLERTASS